MRITVLLENTTERGDMLTEHGLSLYIEGESKNILFDAGQSDAFARNASRLGIDLAKADLAILSHGHYDHGGGLRAFMDINSSAPVYIDRRAFGSFFNAKGKYIGLDASLAKSDRLIYTDGDMRIEGVGELCRLKKQIGGATGLPDICLGLSEMRDGRLCRDEFLHEQYLLIEEDQKRVLFSGCSHRGIIDIAEQFRPDVLVGGFHLSKLEDGELLGDIVKRLELLGTRFYTCHCTGRAQYLEMRKHTRCIEYIACGDSFSI